MSRRGRNQERGESNEGGKEVEGERWRKEVDGERGRKEVDGERWRKGWKVREGEGMEGERGR